jgi:hypothetical protein
MTIPIVLTVGDHTVKLVSSHLNRSGGNATDVNLMMDEIGVKATGMLGA